MPGCHQAPLCGSAPFPWLRSTVIRRGEVCRSTSARGACGRRDGASGGAAGAGEFWRHRAPRFRRHCCTAARYLQERFQALACFLKAGAYGNITPKSRYPRPGWQCVHVWKSRMGSSLRTEGGGFAGYPRAVHSYKNMCIHAQALKSNK